jgi:hypothetical protein
VRLASFLATAFPPLTGLHLDAVCLTEQHLVLEVTSMRRSARCPDCQRRSRRAHRWFTRIIADVSLGTLPLRLRLQARCYRYGNAACPRKTFRERLPAVAPPYQRRTPLLRQRLEAVRFALGGQAGQRLARQLKSTSAGSCASWCLPLSVGMPSPFTRLGHLGGRRKATLVRWTGSAYRMRSIRATHWRARSSQSVWCSTRLYPH